MATFNNIVDLKQFLAKRPFAGHEATLGEAVEVLIGELRRQRASIKSLEEELAELKATVAAMGKR